MQGQTLEKIIGCIPKMSENCQSCYLLKYLDELKTTNNSLKYLPLIHDNSLEVLPDIAAIFSS